MAAVSYLCQMPFQKPTRLAVGLGHGSVLFLMKFAPESGSPASIVSMDLGHIVDAEPYILMILESQQQMQKFILRVPEFLRIQHYFA
jgi:hypothetical protein